MRLASLQAGPFRTRLSISEHLGESAGGGSPRKWEVRFGWVWAGRCQVSYMIYIGYKPQGRSHWRAVACEPTGRMSGTRGPSLVAAFALVAAAGRPGDSCRHGQCRRNVRRDAGCGDTGRAGRRVRSRHGAGRDVASLLDSPHCQPPRRQPASRRRPTRRRDGGFAWHFATDLVPHWVSPCDLAADDDRRRTHSERGSGRIATSTNAETDGGFAWHLATDLVPRWVSPCDLAADNDRKRTHSERGSGRAAATGL